MADDKCVKLVGAFYERQLTEKIEKALGRVTHKEKTEQFFEEVYDTVQEKEVIKEMIQLQPDDPLYVADPNIPSW